MIYKKSFLKKKLRIFSPVKKITDFTDIIEANPPSLGGGLADLSDSPQPCDNTDDIRYTVSESLSSSNCFVESDYVHRLGITLNHPRTKKFVNANSDIQKKMYLKIWDKFKLEYRPELLCDATFDHVFEYCKSGQIHFHASVIFYCRRAGHILGLISDMVKKFIILSKCNISFSEKLMYAEFLKYKSAYVCVKYFEDLEGPHSFNDWCIYMQKEQDQ